MPARKHSEVIKAWANGAQCQYRTHPKLEWQDRPYTGCDEYPWYNAYEYRVKPTFPTLAQIARKAWVSAGNMADPPNDYSIHWDKSTQAVKAAIESGEYSEASST